MKRSLTSALNLALLLVLVAGSAFAGNNANAAVKTDADGANAMVKASIPPPADQAETLDGNELAVSCRADIQGFDAGYCLGVVEGVMASMRVCKRDHSVITLGEAADAMETYLTSHPDKLNERGAVLARKALSKAFPCGAFRQ
ncbi:MAG: Rap1a/Tai family immunity protein [Terriglobales bacterium]